MCSNVKNKRIKAQISKSDNAKTIKTLKSAFSDSFVEFYLVYLRFCLKRLRSKLRNLLTAVCGEFWLKLAFFSIFDPLKKYIFRKSLHSENSPEYLEATDMFGIRNLFEIVKISRFQNNDF